MIKVSTNKEKIYNKEGKVEYLDLVNENDEIIGKEDRDVIYKNDWRNFRVINIMIFTSDNKIIVPKRSADRRVFPNCYDCSVGGHVSSGETYEQAAYRELEEELGITNVELEEIAYFKPYDIGTSSFSKMYKLVYDKELNYDKKGIQKIYYMIKEEISKLIEEDASQFKGDYPKFFKWMEQHNII